MVAVSKQREKIHPHKFTLLVAIASIVMMFAGLTSAYIVKRSQANWEEVETPMQFLYSTAAILFSSLTIQMALRAFKQRDMGRYRVLMGITLALGIAFVAFQWAGFQWMWASGVRFSGAGAGQFLYIIAGLHAVHVLGGLIALIIMFLQGFIGQIKNYSSVPVEIMATYWHFVDGLWLYLLVFLIWLG